MKLKAETVYQIIQSLNLTERERLYEMITVGNYCRPIPKKIGRKPHQILTREEALLYLINNVFNCKQKVYDREMLQGKVCEKF